MKRCKPCVALLLSVVALGCFAQGIVVPWDAPGAGNPFIPGYFADPTIRKFAGTYYLYATTDGNGNGYGPPQVWMSRDFRNWTNMTMNWPTTEVVWAPDVMQAGDGSYRYFYCQPCVLHEGTGQTPRGPWRNVLGAEDAVLVPDRFVHNAITLDGQTFVDDDGATYIYFGTWGIYDGFGCGVARLVDDLQSVAAKRLIPNTEAKDFFEAPYVLKRNGTYYFMYSSGSCHDHTYRVQYATSTAGPMGPYQYQGCVLETNADQTVHGPGHHSILQDGDDYYIVYHRHNIPRGTHGFHRQVCIDRLVFGPDGRIEKVEPTHSGVLPRSVAAMPVMQNLAFRAKTTASSYYSDDFRPSYATDDNNATLWKPATCTGEDYLQIDLGEATVFDQVWTQFEYATYFYQYKIETSSDGLHWALYADKSRNTLAASPLVDRGKCLARYLRITVTGRQKNGHFGGIWNVKVFGPLPPSLQGTGTGRLPQLQVAVAGGTEWHNTAGMLGGSFIQQPDGRMKATFDTRFLFVKGQPFTVTYQQQGKTLAWVNDGHKQSRYADGSYVGKDKRCWADTLIVDADVTNLRIFSYALHPAEIDFYAKHPVTQAQPDVASPPTPSSPLTPHSSLPLVFISANDHPVGATVTEIANGGQMGGAFRGEEPLQVELRQGRQAFRFDGHQQLRSDFPMPPTLCYSAPYTVSAWVLNPLVERVECIAQLMPVRHDLSTVELCNGSDPQNGLMMHNGSFENSGSPLIKEREGQWQHWTVTYDGYMERQYLDGQLVAEKNMLLLLRPQAFMQIGASFDGGNPFSGYLHSLCIYDRPLTAAEVKALHEQPTETDLCLLISPTSLPLKGSLAGAAPSRPWHNPGRWGGTVSHAATVAQPHAGKLALIGPLTCDGLNDTVRASAATLTFALLNGAKRATLLNTPGLHLEATPRGLLCNGHHIKASLRPWNLLTLTADGHCWLNGQPLDHFPALPASARPLPPTPSMTIGDSKAAIGHLLITSAPSTEASVKQAYASFTAAPSASRPLLTVTPLTPQTVRLTLTGNLAATDTYSFTIADGPSTHPVTDGWTRATSVIAPLPSRRSDAGASPPEGGGAYSFQATVLDSRGNVAQTEMVSLDIGESTFLTISDDFADSTLSPEWRLLAGTKADSVEAHVGDGRLTLQSAHGNFNAHADDNGVLLYREVSGDFVVQGRLTALMGSDRHQTPAYNEGGLMVLDDSRSDDQQIVQLGIFPNYNCGNMLTTVSHHGQRPQFPMGNGWQYEPYMQIERRGTSFHIRISTDGRQWHEVGGSPVSMPLLTADKPLKVGFFQVTYTDRLGSATFDDFRLWQRKM